MRSHPDLDPWDARPMAVIDGLDFLGVPTQDPERSRTFYRDVLGLRPDEHADWEQWASDTCFGIWEPEKQGMPFVAPKGNPSPWRGGGRGAGATVCGIGGPEKQGMPFVAQKGNPWPLRCDDVAAMRAELEGK